MHLVPIDGFLYILTCLVSGCLDAFVPFKLIAVGFLYELLVHPDLSIWLTFLLSFDLGGLALRAVNLYSPHLVVIGPCL